MSNQWVQHISGQGEKWELSGKLYNQEDNKDWQVIAKNDPSPFNYHYLPKSEYRLCEPPERWEEVKVQVVEYPHIKDTRDPGGIYDGAKKLAQLQCGGAYRIKTLIVEKKVST